MLACSQEKYKTGPKQVTILVSPAGPIPGAWGEVAGRPAAAAWKSDTTQAFRAGITPALLSATTLQYLTNRLSWGFPLLWKSVRWESLRLMFSIHPERLDMRAMLERA